MIKGYMDGWNGPSTGRMLVSATCYQANVTDKRILIKYYMVKVIRVTISCEFCALSLPRNNVLRRPPAVNSRNNVKLYCGITTWITLL